MGHTNSTDLDDEIALTIRIPKALLVMHAPPPATVTQKTAEQHFGIPPKKFRAMARDGLFPVKAMGRTLFASYEDVRKAVTQGAVARARIDRTLAQARVEPEHAGPMSLEAARRYLESARSASELRQRKREIRQLGGELERLHGPTVEGGPNPDHDEKLYDHGTDLIAVGLGLRVQQVPPGPEAVRRGGITCCWCPRTAYATKQAWDPEKWGWCGGPVCEVCARKRKANERIVALGSNEILVPARDPTVPASYYPPRRPRRR